MMKPKTTKLCNEDITHQRGANVMDDGLLGAFEPLNGPEQGRRKRYSAGDVIYREGARIDSVGLIRTGLVKLLCYLPNGKARIMRLYSVDHCTGLEALLGQPCEHTAIAASDLEIESFPIKSLQHLHRDNPEAFVKLLHQWQASLTQADRWILDFSTGELKQRVARLLEFLAELEYGESSNRVELLTVSEMADMLGATPESVSHHLAGFKRNEILKKPKTNSQQNLYQLDTERLQHEM